MRPNYYCQRNQNLAELGYDSYQDYLASPLWRDYVQKNIKGKKCACCGKPAHVFHHQSYDPKTLELKRKKGKFTGPMGGALIPICNECHYKIEFREDGTKRFTSAEIRAARRELQIKNGCVPSYLCESCAGRMCSRKDRGKPGRKCGLCKKKQHNRAHPKKPDAAVKPYKRKKLGSMKYTKFKPLIGSDEQREQFERRLAIQAKNNKAQQEAREAMRPTRQLGGSPLSKFLGP